MLNIIKGKQAKAQKIVCYGPEGVGKSTLAANCPNPLILDIERGTAHLDVARIEIVSDGHLELTLDELIKDAQGYQTIVIDTIDWAETLKAQALCQQNGKDSIEEFGYGKGYPMLEETMVKLLAKLTTLTEKGVHVVLLAHAQIKRFDDPATIAPYDRYELKLTKKCSLLVKEWADALLFLNFHTEVKTGKAEKDPIKGKAAGGTDRYIFTERCAAYDAKNRHSLPSVIPLPLEGLPEPLTPLFQPVPTKSIPTPPPVGKQPSKPVTEPYKVPLTEEQFNQIEQYWTAMSKTKEARQKAHEYYGVTDFTELSRGQAAHLIETLQTQMNALANVTEKQIKETDEIPFGFPKELEALEPYADAVNKAIIAWGWVQAGQTYKDLPAEKIEGIRKRPEQFCKSVGIPLDTLKK